MERTQISLEPEMLRRARRKAGELGISFAEYVRRLLARDLERPQPSADPSSVFDLGDSGGTDIARDKDLLVGQAAGTERASEADSDGGRSLHRYFRLVRSS